MGALSLSSPLILRCILRRQPPCSTTRISSITPSFIKLLKHTPCISIVTPPHPISRTTLSSLRSLSTTTTTTAAEAVISTETDALSEPKIDEKPPIESESESRISNTHKELLSKLKSMSIKEKKELGSYANSLGKKLKSQQVGKSGVTDSVATALVETLEANELLKLKIHNNCPGELDDVVSRLEEATGSVVVGRIGRTIIIYRPSLTKLKAEEKKKQAMKVFLKRRAAFKSSYQGRTQSRGQSASPSNRSRAYRRS
ncbi:putative RNA-binding, CRM domain, YhbY-like superfamily [Helianthus annuus]|nr:putative RNA-binding, CRM domain, YhbY-like superfamily [Helianthus annuus]